MPGVSGASLVSVAAFTEPGLERKKGPSGGLGSILKGRAPRGRQREPHRIVGAWSEAQTMIRSSNVWRCVPMALCPVLAITLAGCGTKLVWRPDLGGAMQLATRENRFVVVAYWSALNADCMEMERTVFQSQDVVDIMAGTVPVRLDPLLHKAWAREAGVSRVPSFVVYAPDGRILRRHEGFLDEAAFRGFIVAAKLSV